MKLYDIISGEYYVAHYYDEPEPTIIKSLIDGGFTKSPGIRTQKNYFDKINNWSCKQNIRLASVEEIHWLNCCIENKQFVSYSEVMLTFIDPTINYQQDSEYNNILIKLLTT